MPALLPADAVGCMGTCLGATTVTAVAPAAFNGAAAAHGKHLTIAAGGATASWSDGGPSAGCNEVALLQQTNLSFSVKVSGAAQFMEVNLSCNLWSKKTISRSARAIGVDHQMLVETIIGHSLERQGLLTEAPLQVAA